MASFQFHNIAGTPPATLNHLTIYPNPVKNKPAKNQVVDSLIMTAE